MNHTKKCFGAKLHRARLKLRRRFDESVAARRAEMPKLLRRAHVLATARCPLKLK